MSTLRNVEVFHAFRQAAGGGRWTDREVGPADRDPARSARRRRRRRRQGLGRKKGPFPSGPPDVTGGRDVEA